MSGICLIWSRERPLENDDRANATLRRCERFSTPSILRYTHCCAATWRRTSGEFECSGLIHDSQAGGKALWLGQVLSDLGESSHAVIQHAEAMIADPAAMYRHSGAFVLAVLKDEGRTINVLNDRYAQYPLYLWQDEAGGVVTSELSLLAPWLAPPYVNKHAVSLFLRAGEFIDDLTLLAGVRVLRGGSVVTVTGGEFRERRVWTWRSRSDHTLGFRDASVECGRLLRTSIEHVSRANPRLGVPLSGGLDSRFLLGLCPNRHLVPAFTMGLKGCRDIECASTFAARIGCPHSVWEWQPELFPPLWPDGVAATGAAIGIAEMFMLPYARRMSAQCDSVLNGLAGDVLLGGNFVKTAWLRSTNLNDLAERAWRWRVPAEGNQWVNRLTAEQDDMGPRSHWVCSIRMRSGESPPEILYDWLVENRVFRFTNCGTSLLRRCVESHAPFFHNQLVDLLLRVPLRYRFKHRLYLDCLSRTCPDAAQVAWQRTGVPPSWGYSASIMSLAVHRVASEVRKRLALPALPGMAVSDAGGWLRDGAWASPVESTLLDERTLSRGFFVADEVRALLESHRAGRDEARLLGRLMTIELLVRQMEQSGVAHTDNARSEAFV